MVLERRPLQVHTTNDGICLVPMKLLQKPGKMQGLTAPSHMNFPWIFPEDSRRPLIRRLGTPKVMPSPHHVLYEDCQFVGIPDFQTDPIRPILQIYIYIYTYIYIISFAMLTSPTSISIFRGCYNHLGHECHDNSSVNAATT